MLNFSVQLLGEFPHNISLFSVALDFIAFVSLLGFYFLKIWAIKIKMCRNCIRII